MMSPPRTLVWFRGKDLRIADHGPLVRGLAEGNVIPVFVLDPYFFDPHRAQDLPHRIQFLLESLEELARVIASLGSTLICLQGKSVEVIPRVAEAWNVSRVLAHRWVEPFGRARDRQVARALRVPLELLEGETLHPPGTLRTGSGSPYSVFTPFSRSLRREAAIARPLPAPSTLPPVPSQALREHRPPPSLSELGICRNANLQPGGEQAAHKRLQQFLSRGLGRYGTGRDHLGQDATSRLSADIKFGTLSVRSIWWAVADRQQDCCHESVERFLTELIWREFSYSSLWDRPNLLKSPFRSSWTNFPWREDAAGWKAWTEGRTGYPVVDAAARELIATGFVHGRARMITASFLCKHLLIDYRQGEQHFMKYLTDGDWAQNNAGWQWSAGSGCDAQPYFRVFNPVAQGEKFDPEGAYVRRWLPPLAKLPSRYIHKPWAAPSAVLEAAGVCLGKNYPHPVVEHAFARQRFLDAAKAHLKPSP